ncbi:hypothetical protein F480_01885 [Bibersteinia trehalosi Y31]|uniref:Hemophilus-specific protein n=2 Tax=Bibersteinia trehalosi TaxID=47735 RepID=W0R4S4_BIBTR|nr:hypothetical protein [Bibersteinia trehalosi]AHG86149.1 hypothetical protein F544_9200 [Bibersteinia trehalosi USDA-ARS-USMARC-190]OAQ15316.1 hypothetical protein F480_01885 [Bibersteinia trehalosi Y31]
MDSTMSLRFDKLRFVKRLQEANQTPEMAEAFADALDGALEQSQSSLLTRQEFELRISQLETRLQESFNNTLYKMAGLIIVGVGLMMSFMKFFN